MSGIEAAGVSARCGARLPRLLNDLTSEEGERLPRMGLVGCKARSADRGDRVRVSTLSALIFAGSMIRWPMSAALGVGGEAGSGVLHAYVVDERQVAALHTLIRMLPEEFNLLYFDCAHIMRRRE